MTPTHLLYFGIFLVLSYFGVFIAEYWLLKPLLKWHPYNYPQRMSLIKALDWFNKIRFFGGSWNTWALVLGLGLMFIFIFIVDRFDLYHLLSGWLDFFDTSGG